MQSRMDHSDLMTKFLKERPKYVSLGEILSKGIGLLLNEHDINFLLVESRVKDTIQFIEKIKRKKYRNPLEDMEDICGIRIICYFQKDIQKIERLIKKEFHVLERLSKTNKISPTEFGYRSNHLIVRIKDDWEKIPNTKPLINLKCEIQTRTILMHAWAEIEHKLAYKRRQHIPKHFRRKFSRLSAKLEEADEQFQELANGIISYKKKVIKKAKNPNQTIPLDLDLDTLQGLMDFYLPNQNKDIKETRDFLDQAIGRRSTIEHIVNSLELAGMQSDLEEKQKTQVQILRDLMKAG